MVRSGTLRSDIFPNYRFRVAVGVDGGHGARLAERLFKLSNKGGRWGLMVVAQSEAIAERPDLNFGVVVGGDGGMASALGKTEGGKSACGPITQFAQQKREHCA